MNQCLIKFHDQQPIPGGWGFNLSFKGETFQVRGSTPQRVVDALARVYAVNGEQKTPADLWNQCNEIWTAKCPERAMTVIKSKKPMPPNKDHWEHGPEKFGPVLWFWLHSFGMKFDKGHFTFALARVGDLLDPAKSPGNGCVKCFAEWKAILSTMEHTSVEDEASAARWTFDVHNRINKKLGYRQFSFETAAKMYGWKVIL